MPNHISIIDNQYKKLVSFVWEHPEYKDRLPKKAVYSDDGFYGAYAAMVALSNICNRDRNISENFIRERMKLKGV